MSRLARTPFLAALLALPLFLGACGDEDKDSGDDSSSTAACELVAENDGCPECLRSAGALAANPTQTPERAAALKLLQQII